MTNTMEMNTMSLEELIAAQENNRTSRRGNFTTYGSKKKLEDAEVLDAKTLKMVKDIKGTFSFALHDDKQYLVVTLYNKTEKYRFVVIDLNTLIATEQPSIKEAKKLVGELVAKEGTLSEKGAEVVEEEKEEKKAAPKKKAPAKKRRKEDKEEEAK